MGVGGGDDVIIAFNGVMMGGGVIKVCSNNTIHRLNIHVLRLVGCGDIEATSLDRT